MRKEGNEQRRHQITTSAANSQIVYKIEGIWEDKFWKVGQLFVLGTHQKFPSLDNRYIKRKKRIIEWGNI